MFHLLSYILYFVLLACVAQLEFWFCRSHQQNILIKISCLCPAHMNFLHTTCTVTDNPHEPQIYLRWADIDWSIGRFLGVASMSLLISIKSFGWWLVEILLFQIWLDLKLKAEFNQSNVWFYMLTDTLVPLTAVSFSLWTGKRARLMTDEELWSVSESPGSR